MTMDSEQLQSLAADIRRGRTEDQNLEWKRVWYDLKQQASKEEFRKDVAALANSCTQEAGYLIFGLSEGQFTDAPLPRDEAALQQIVKEIVPLPTVSFEEVVVRDGSEEIKVSVVAVLPPYERPYVTKRGDFNLVPVRRGSSIGTATRFELDSFYRVKARLPELSVAWEHWPSRSLAKAKGTVSKVLPVSRPIVSLHQVITEFRSRLEQYEIESRDKGFPTLEQTEDFQVRSDKFLSRLQFRPDLAYWYYQRRSGAFFSATPFSVVLTNNGTQVANRPKVRIQFPDWLYIFDEAPKKPKNYVPEPFIPRPIDESAAAKRRLKGDRRLDLLNIHSPVMMPRDEPRDGSWTANEGSSATFWSLRLEHKHKYRIGNPLRVMALPTAPGLTGTFVVQAELFCEELSDWISQDLEVELVESEAGK